MADGSEDYPANGASVVPRSDVVASLTDITAAARRLGDEVATYLASLA